MGLVNSKQPKIIHHSWLFYFLRGFNGFTFGDKIFLSSKVSSRLGAGEWWPESVLAHEKVHWAQFQEVGFLKFVLGYVFSRRKRLAYELEAFRRELEFWPNRQRGLAVLGLALEKSYFLGLSPGEGARLIEGA